MWNQGRAWALQNITINWHATKFLAQFICTVNSASVFFLTVAFWWPFIYKGQTIYINVAYHKTKNEEVFSGKHGRRKDYGEKTLHPNFKLLQNATEL